MSPADTIRVLLVGTIPGARPATCDPALDLVATTAAALTRYERERSDAARAALVMRPDAQPALFDVRALTPSALRYVRAADDAETRYHRAFLAACHRYVDARGIEHRASVTKPGLFEVADDAWLDEVFAEYGNAAVREIAKVALDRAEAGPRALAPFVLPPGLTLPR